MGFLPFRRYHHIATHPWAFVSIDVLSQDKTTVSMKHRVRSAAGSSSSAPSATNVIAAGMPFLMYGTAWKKEMTAQHVAHAVRAGFRFFDTANQPLHYNEAGVGDGWTLAAAELQLPRSDLFLQTKFTPDKGQDPNKIPYDRTASIEDQVQQSPDMSLKHLQTEYLDSLVMHSPLPTIEDTLRVWKTMESFVDDGRVRRLGISNCYNYDVFVSLYEQARIKPSVLQNRFHSKTQFDTKLRAFCKSNGIWYQSFWTLTANRHALAKPEIRKWADEKGLTPQTLLFAFLLSLGYVTPLSGTTSLQHMKEDFTVMQRIQNGETIFDGEAELRSFATLLGMPDL